MLLDKFAVMSFPRARIVRFNEIQPKVRHSLNCGSINKTNKTQRTEKCFPVGSSQSAVVEPLSQCHSGVLQLFKATSKSNLRPHSSGDERLFVLDKSEIFENCLVSKEDSEEKQFFEVTTMLKMSAPFHHATVSCVENESKNSLLRKSSLLGSLRLPLQRKQQHVAPTPIPCPKKSNPRIVKTSGNKTSQKIHWFNAKGSQRELVLKGRSAAKWCALERQFEILKNKMEQLRNEIQDKEKSLLETYEGLLLLKKKLEKSGKTIFLEDLDIDCKGTQHKSDINMLGVGTNAAVAVDPKMLCNMNETIKQICKFLMVKRLALATILEKIVKEPMNPKELQQNIKSFQVERINLEKVETDKKIVNLATGSGDYSTFANQIKLLEEKLSKKEQMLAKTAGELLEAQRKNEETSAASERMISELKEKVKSMEHELNQSKTTVQDQEKTFLKSCVKDVEVKFKRAKRK